MGNKVALHNLGCKVNAYEIEAMQQLLEEAGYEIVPFEPGADIYVINTCTVTNIADRKSRQMLHKAKKMNPEAIVVATGCYVQTGGEKLEKDEAIDLVLGNNQKINIVEALAEYAENKPGHGSHVIKINQTKEYEDLSIDHTAEHVRAYIKVQDGCNQFCTYCIIPYARGRVRSRNIESVLKEVRALAEKGYKEVVLTGIHLSSYGVDFPDEKKETLLSLIRAVHEIEGIQRIRLGSLEPGIVTREFAEGIAALPKVCPHFHLSLQSGCDETLERMNRRYRSGEYRERCELLREVYGNPALTTDVIVGFPQESEEEFRKSYDFVDSIRFYETHIFKYSRRQGTKAAAMDGQLTEAEKSFRSEKMIELHHRHAGDYEKSMLGKKLEVLIEEEYTKDGRTWYLGHSREYIKTAVPKSEVYGVNDIVSVKAEGFLEEHIMTGEAVE
ncbi:tRNA (N(6)-L-threonylcarbamoyladenosine(37)-C(2))-methylthiotransferase MtaB [Blautia massiliensis]|uniref:tRNA (N(6)-L-threonylcarbamoyladenosine(37)-C(2))- methylthiotransferase MtaB n=1 Tax=Blautia TaxID=572511 RepID=UPI0015704671|nr:MULTISPECIES: tRNA (N(6)-L-threonylcarbamoyladenosine(37)-C(2))-methylthiotransferase MtaB [Blautia]MBC3532435.1 tRNA (N(6)-L-threonylcarbamoyladenosine(37)-C(2))-methylthiotransferase MtaB [Blautia massiliensis (ex Durand et al. 2017)]MCC2726639.1 tRNA (N(6)-L-threonylcarbamoyladenosine(37)-C(2))-methylthiotransferase MtaB [Blautia sp. MSK22_86]NSF57241.1 tRNA (N(6)-L-threonylcarbamoyladenosine(37)-C(2))-methylthiotransferase MtaB [Blautia massiliensis (ex Durand et al. 2017)]NSK72586.1 tRN